MAKVAVLKAWACLLGKELFFFKNCTQRGALLTVPSHAFDAVFPPQVAKILSCDTGMSFTSILLTLSRAMHGEDAILNVNVASESILSVSADKMIDPKNSGSPI